MNECLLIVMNYLLNNVKDILKQASLRPDIKKSRSTAKNNVRPLSIFPLKPSGWVVEAVRPRHVVTITATEPHADHSEGT